MGRIVIVSGNRTSDRRARSLLSIPPLLPRFVCLIAGIAGSHLAEVMDVCTVLCRYRHLRRANHCFKVVLPVVFLMVCDIVISRLGDLSPKRIVVLQRKRKLPKL